MRSYICEMFHLQNQYVYIRSEGMHLDEGYTGKSKKCVKVYLNTESYT